MAIPVCTVEGVGCRFRWRPSDASGPVFVCRYSATKAILIGMICTFFEALNIPVFWPILVMYFIILFTITMKRQIKVGLCPVCTHQHWCGEGWGGGGDCNFNHALWFRQLTCFSNQCAIYKAAKMVHGKWFRSHCNWSGTWPSFLLALVAEPY